MTFPRYSRPRVAISLSMSRYEQGTLGGALISSLTVPRPAMEAELQILM